MKMYPELHDSGLGGLGPAPVKSTVLQKQPSTGKDGPLRALKKVRRAAIFPLQILLWGAIAVMMYATLGLDVVSALLEQWEQLE
jgi:hypothetical protein